MNYLDQLLFEDCRYGNTPAVEELLQQGANPNAKDNYGRTPITIAAEYGYTDIITTLIQYGADPNTKDNYGRTPITTAAEYGYTDIITTLIQHGADPHATDPQGQTALHYALNWRRYETAQYLLTQLKLDPNSKDQWGRTPFLIAAATGNIKILQLLIQLGADPHTTDYKGQNALHYATDYGRDEVIEYLITQLQFDPNAQDHEGLTPLRMAILKKDLDLLKHLISLGANPYATDHKGQSALHYVLHKAYEQKYHDIAQQKYHDIAQYLLIHLQVDPNTQDDDGITPLILAILNEDIKMVQLLTQLGANPYATDRQGRNALHYAVKKYCRNAVEYLITHLQLDPNAQDHEGNTPLHIGLQKKSYDIAKTLIRLGANPHIPNHQGQTPTTIAHQRQIRLPKTQPSSITL